MRRNIILFIYFSRDSRDSLVASDREEKSADVKKTTPPPPPAAAKPKPMTASEIRQQLAGNTVGHGRMNYKDTNPICRLFFKIDLLTYFAGLCLTDFIDWRYIHSWLVFSTQFVNCCSHGRRNYTCVLLPLREKVSLTSSPLPSFPN